MRTDDGSTVRRRGQARLFDGRVSVATFEYVDGRLMVQVDAPPGTVVFSLSRGIYLKLPDGPTPRKPRQDAPGRPQIDDRARAECTPACEFA